MERRNFLIGSTGALTLCALDTQEWAVAASSASRVQEQAVTPEDFGGPQVKNSIVLAMTKAGELGLPLRCAPVDYLTDTALIPAKGLRWYANGCRIVATTNNSSAAVRIINDDVQVRGLLRVNLSDPGGTPTANRGHVLVGDWRDASVAPAGFQFDDIELEGGHMNSNGFAIAGGANNIRGNSIRCGDSDKIGRLFLAHWGNFAQHFKTGRKYTHAPGYMPTTHPHAISIREISAGRLSCPTTDFVAVAAISAGYDIDIGRISGIVDKSGSTPNDLVLLTAGDLGLAYATPAERSRGMWGIRLGSVEGRSSGNGINRIGIALYHDLDDTPQPPEYYFAKIEDTVGRVNIAVTGKFHSALAGTNGFGRSRYGIIEAVGGRVCVGIPNYNRDTVIETLRCKQSFTRGLEIAGAGGDANVYPQGITVNTLEIDGTGTSTTGAVSQSDKSGLLIQSAEQVRIDNIKIKSTATGGYAGVLGYRIKNVHLGDTQLPESYDPALSAAYLNGESRPDITVGHINGRRSIKSTTNQTLQ